MSYKILTTAWEQLKAMSREAIASAYAKCSAKGATMPASLTLANLPGCIDSITGSINPDPTNIPTLTQFKSGKFTSDKTLYNFAQGDISVINDILTFAPKIFIIHSEFNKTITNTGSSKLYLTMGYYFASDSGKSQRGLTYVWKNTDGRATVNTAAGFTAKDNGVSVIGLNSGSATAFYPSVTYYWYAWG